MAHEYAPEMLSAMDTDVANLSRRKVGQELERLGGGNDSINREGGERAWISLR